MLHTTVICINPTPMGSCILAVLVQGRLDFDKNPLEEEGTSICPFHVPDHRVASPGSPKELRPLSRWLIVVDLGQIRAHLWQYNTVNLNFCGVHRDDFSTSLWMLYLVPELHSISY